MKEVACAPSWAALASSDESASLMQRLQNMQKSLSEADEARNVADNMTDRSGSKAMEAVQHNEIPQAADAPLEGSSGAISGDDECAHDQEDS